MAHGPIGPDLVQAPALVVDATGVADARARRWLALHGAAMAVAALTDPPSGHAHVGEGDAAAFAARVAGLPAGRQRLIDEYLADMIAVMKPGVSALAAIRLTGGPTAAGARALLREFSHACEAIEAVLR